MSDVAALCERCGKHPARRTYHGQPTCERCELGHRSTTESKRLCPVDGALMAKRLVGRLLVDECTLCGGIWLDAGEMEVLRRELLGPAGARSIGSFLSDLSR